MCNCDKCRKRRCRVLIKTTAAAVVGTNTQLTIPTTTFNDGQYFNLKIEQPIPTAGLGLSYTVLDGTTIIPVLDKNGLPVLGYSLFPGRCYTARYGISKVDGTAIIQIKTKLCEQPYVVYEDIETGTV